jgi:hypothetical protein
MRAACAATGWRLAALVAAGPRIDSGDPKSTEQLAAIPRLRVPARPSRTPAEHVMAAVLLVDRPVTDSPAAALSESGLDVEPAVIVAVALRHPCETHPRSPERATTSGRGILAPL